MKNLLNLLFSFLILIFCDFTAFAINQEEIGADLINWNKKQKINLLDHQLKPIDYLEKNPDVKGLLINHYLGTGKTYLAIGFAERNPFKNIVILAPSFLISHWQKNINSYGVTNNSRYKLISHEDPSEILSLNLENTILIIDESHRLINKISSPQPSVAELYSKLYLMIRKSNRILSLTGTPIYGNPVDLSYQINLVSGKDILTFNISNFRQEFTKISNPKSFVRGNFAESNTLPIILGFGSSIILIPILPVNFMVFSACGSLIPLIIKKEWAINNYSLREYDIESLTKYIRPYVSYYDFREQKTKDYPTSSLEYKEISYNEYQMNFLMNFADNKLSVSEVLLLQRDKIKIDDVSYIKLNSSRIQESMKNEVGHSREIGNLIFKTKEGSPIFPAKFIEIVNVIKQSKGPVVIYSHYYHNGILSLKKYLDYKGYQGHYTILNPKLSPTEYESIISRYNRGEIKILMIHPDITEGISLVGTDQMHILEPSVNKSAQDQIIGRAVRYKSHSHLPENKRHVSVYVWKQVFRSLDLSYMSALRKNWYNNFGEMNYYGERSLIDSNSMMKSISPDEHACSNMDNLEKNMKMLTEQLYNHSIEQAYNKSR